MRGKVIFIALVLLAVAKTQGQDKPYYTIVAPSSIRPNSKYQMSLAVTGIDDPMDVNVTMTNGKMTQQKIISVQPNSPTVDFLEIGALDRNSYGYKLYVQGLNGVIFNESASILLNDKRSSILIQTDKGMYKTNDLVQFRVLVVDIDTKPVNMKNQPNEVYINDPKGNKVKQWKNVKLTNGVFKSNMRLSRDPAPGNWQIYFAYGRDAQRVEQSKPFEVAEYVLPKFEITASQPVINTYKSGKLIFGAEAKYTFGKPVKGTVTVSQIYYLRTRRLAPNARRRPRFQSKPITYMTKVFPIDGKATIEIDLKELRVLQEESKQDLYFELLVLEELTGVSLKSSIISVPIYVQDSQITHISSEQLYKPGLAYSCYIKVAKQDGTPIVDKENPVSVTAEFGNYGNQTTEMTYTLNDQGMAFVSIMVPKSAQQFHIVVKYRDVQPYYIFLVPSLSKSNNFIRASVLTNPMTIKKYVRVQVSATEALQYVHYLIIGKNGVLESKQVNLKKAKVFVFKFWATLAMAPEAILIVYYYRPNGEIVADRVELKFDNRLDNYANIKLSATKLEPRQTVTITVDSKCNSYVGLLGVDQSVKLLKSGNDIDKNAVLNEIKQYTQFGWGNLPDLPLTIDHNLYSVDWEDSYQQLMSSGVVMFTNAKTYTLRTYEYLSTSDDMGIPNALDGAAAARVLAAARPKNAKRAGSSSVTNEEPIIVRNNFPETWIWEDVSDNKCKPVKLTKKVPDTITSWLITAFSLNKANGLGLNENPTSLTVFRPFFISTTLPYSVKRGEVLTLSIQIFNYLSTDQEVTVTMTNDLNQYDFTDDVDPNYQDNTSRVNTLTVTSNTGSTMSFIITPKKIGYIAIKITARCEMAGDAIEQMLLVEPEGSPVYVNKAVLLDLRTTNTKTATVTIDTPDVATVDSTTGQVSIFGDIMGPTIKNLEKLIVIPSGCGEQNMIRFVPNLLVIKYLYAVKQLTTDLRTRIVSNLEIGYQRQLNYQHNDGSFSCWGQSDASGSTWLTAFVVRYFAEAQSYISIDKDVLKRALDWLVSKQADDGRFPEFGQVAHTELQSDVGDGIGLTANVMIALLAQPDSSAYNDVIQKAYSFVSMKLKTVDHLYSMALAAYALQRMDPTFASDLMAQLNRRAIEKDGMKWWEKSSSVSENSWWSYTRTTNIEITAIVLATYVEAGKSADAFPILQWLVKQRNSQGGYYSTQDTILSIEALTKIATQFYAKTTDISIAVTMRPSGRYNFKVNESNKMVLQSFDTPLNTKSIKFVCKGNGFAVAQVAYKYYVVLPEPAPRFNLEVTIRDTSSTKRLNLNICSSFIADDKTKQSGMAIVEVAFPSGYTFDRGTLEKLRQISGVSTVELTNLDTSLAVYYNSIGETEVCFGAEATKTCNVALLKPALVKVYDYYDNSKRASKFYDVSGLNGPTSE